MDAQGAVLVLVDGMESDGEVVCKAHRKGGGDMKIMREMNGKKEWLARNGLGVKWVELVDAEVAVARDLRLMAMLDMPEADVGIYRGDGVRLMVDI